MIAVRGGGRIARKGAHPVVKLPFRGGVLLLGLIDLKGDLGVVDSLGGALYNVAHARVNLGVFSQNSFGFLVIFGILVGTLKEEVAYGVCHKKNQRDGFLKRDKGVL